MGHQWWVKLDRATELLRRDLADRGVTRVECVAGFEPAPRALAFWFGVTTDRERDALPTQPYLDVARAAVAEAGMTVDDLGDLRTGVQSQETVDREYQGSWLLALR